MPRVPVAGTRASYEAERPQQTVDTMSCQIKTMGRTQYFCIPVFFYVIFLFFASPAIDAPLTYDELSWPVAAELLYVTH